MKNSLIKFLYIIGPRNQFVGAFLICLIPIVIGLLVGLLTQWWPMAWTIALMILAVLMVAALWADDLDCNG